MELKLAVEIACTLGEGPVWDEKRQLICWIDILKGEIHQFNPQNRQLQTIAVDSLIGAFVFSQSGSIIAALQEGLCEIDPLTGIRKMISHTAMTNQQMRFNDGKCDPSGRLWIGTVALDEIPAAGSLYLVTADPLIQKEFAVSLKIPDLSLSNGMAWSPDRQKFYFIDTPTRQISCYTFNAETAELGDPHIAFAIDPADGYPDGMTIDQEGMLWIAHWGGWQVCRWNPESGEKLLTVKLPVAHVSSVGFGGEQMDDLYITTARKDLSPQDLLRQPLAGSLFVLKNSGFKGLAAFRYNKLVTLS